MTNDIVVVDVDLIARLRREGKFMEANRLIIAHQHSLMKEYKEGKKINAKIASKIFNVKRTKKGLCPRCGKAPDKEHIYCLECRKKFRLSARKYRWKI